MTFIKNNKYKILLTIWVCVIYIIFNELCDYRDFRYYVHNIAGDSYKNDFIYFKYIKCRNCKTFNYHLDKADLSIDSKLYFANQKILHYGVVHAITPDKLFFGSVNDGCKKFKDHFGFYLISKSEFKSQIFSRGTVFPSAIICNDSSESKKVSNQYYLPIKFNEIYSVSDSESVRIFSGLPSMEGYNFALKNNHILSNRLFDINDFPELLYESTPRLRLNDLSEDLKQWNAIREALHGGYVCSVQTAAGGSTSCFKYLSEFYTLLIIFIFWLLIPLVFMVPNSLITSMIRILKILFDRSSSKFIVAFGSVIYILGFAPTEIQFILSWLLSGLVFAYYVKKYGN